MTESQILSNLKALGAKDTTSDVQKKNGTTCFTLPTGDCISEHKTGYIRKNLLNSNGGIYTCYQLNPTYKSVHKYILEDGEVKGMVTMKGKGQVPYIFSEYVKIVIDVILNI